MGIVDRLRSRFQRESRQAAVALADEGDALRLEGEEEKAEAGLQTEARQFAGGLADETALIRDIVALHSAKYTLIRGFAATNSMTVRLANAKKRLFTNLLQGGKRVRTFARSKAAGLAGGGISADFDRKLRLWVGEQEKELQMLESEMMIQIKENEERLAQTAPVIDQNRQIRGKLKEFSSILGRQIGLLTNMKTNLLRKIRAEMRELQDAKAALSAEVAESRTQRGY